MNSEKVKSYPQVYLGDVRGISVYICLNCNSRIYGKGGYCRNCGAKLKENQYEQRKSEKD
jgi:predicted amidophosphoribosyltransferase